MDIAVLGVPWNSAGTADGVAGAPAALRGSGLIQALERRATVMDHGDVELRAPSPERDGVTRVIDPDGLRSLLGAVRDGVSEILAAGRFPLVIGGDCPVLLGCLAAIGGEARGLLFVDGHEDAYPPERSPTGEAADMELGFALGVVDTPWWPELAAISPLVQSRHTRVLGPRDRATLEEDHVPSIADRVPIVDAAEVASDPAGVTRTAVESLDRPWWFHLDLDVLSSEALAAVDYPQDDGLEWRELAIVAETALAAGPVGWDVTIYNPDLDPDRIHAQRIVRFLADAIGALAPR
jgi:arginase